MANINVCSGAVRQPVGSHELVEFLLLMGGQDIDAGFTELARALAGKLQDFWQEEVMAPISRVNPLEALSSFSRDLDPELAAAIPTALRQCQLLLESDDEVRRLNDYFPDLADELADYEHLVTSMLRFSQTIRIEIQT